MSTLHTTQPSQPFRVRLDVKVPMRDGVLLSTDIYLPNAPGPFPTLLIRTIYDNQWDRYLAWAMSFIEHGYAVAMQDCRGRHDSDGAWEPYIHETEDGYDTHEWLGAQPWCDGTIGTFGVSYLGFTQTLPATLRSRSLRALVPIAGQQDNFGHFYVDGALQLHIALNFINMAGRTMQWGTRRLMNSEQLYRRLPLVSALDDTVDLPFYRQVIEHSTFDEFWRSYSLRDRYGEVETPAYFITGWYDNLVHEGFKLYRGWSQQARSAAARRQTKLLVGPWSHQNIGSAEPFGAIGFGGQAAMDITAEHLRWYDRRLKGVENGIDDEPPIRLFVMGANVWRHEHEWPLARTQYTRYYLHSRGGANSIAGNGDVPDAHNQLEIGGARLASSGTLTTNPPSDEPTDGYVYDPADPVPTVGGPILFLDDSGPWDRRAVERRDDVLVYTSAPLAAPVEVTGPVTLTLYAASSAPDTDFTGTLVDVHPDGKAIILCEGLCRARYRESLEQPTLIRPGQVYRYEIDLWDTSNVFKAGHCIRLEVSSSNFPRFDRNPNTGHRPGMDAALVPATQTIYHNGEYPSHLTLPVIPA